MINLHQLTALQLLQAHISRLSVWNSAMPGTTPSQIDFIKRLPAIQQQIIDLMDIVLLNEQSLTQPMIETVNEVLLQLQELSQQYSAPLNSTISKLALVASSLTFLKYSAAFAMATAVLDKDTVQANSAQDRLIYFKPRQELAIKLLDAAIADHPLPPPGQQFLDEWLPLCLDDLTAIPFDFQEAAGLLTQV